VTDELGGPAAVSDPSTWQAFVPDDVQTAPQESTGSAEFVPDGVQIPTDEPAGKGQLPEEVELSETDGRQPGARQWPLPARTSPNGDRP
jgi:hypothetical protein